MVAYRHLVFLDDSLDYRHAEINDRPSSRFVRHVDWPLNGHHWISVVVAENIFAKRLDPRRTGLLNPYWLCSLYQHNGDAARAATSAHALLVLRRTSADHASVGHGSLQNIQS